MVPNDYRRTVWLRHSGNVYLQLDINATKRVHFCEKHFYEKDIKHYTGWKALNKIAIPKPFSEDICSCNESSRDEICDRILISSRSGIIHTEPKYKN